MKIKTSVALTIVLAAGLSALILVYAQSKLLPISISSVGTLAPQRLVYLNTNYGFRFFLPLSWKGYTIAETQWEGYSLDQNGNQRSSERGPLISIRHPLWMADRPRQDIPIMVFTISQWDELQNDKFHIGAAPINPSELGRNAAYVFALPARYNFAFPQGFEEVDQLIQAHSLQPL